MWWQIASCPPSPRLRCVAENGRGHWPVSLKPPPLKSAAPTTWVGNVQLLHLLLFLAYSHCAGHGSRLKSRKAAKHLYPSLSEAQEGKGGEGISTSDLKSRVSSVCSLHVRASPVGQQSPGSGMCQRFLRTITGFEHPHLARVQELEKQLRADIKKLVHTYQSSL